LLKLKKALSVKIIGEERAKNSPANSYQLVWYPLKKLSKIKSFLYSVEARDWLMNFLPFG